MGRTSLRLLAAAFVAVGVILAIAGVALIFPPAALIIAGVGLAAAGLFGIEVE